MTAVTSKLLPIERRTKGSKSSFYLLRCMASEAAFLEQLFKFFLIFFNSFLILSQWWGGHCDRLTANRRLLKVSDSSHRFTASVDCKSIR